MRRGAVPFDGVSSARVQRTVSQARQCWKPIVECRVGELECQDSVHGEEVAEFKEELWG